MPELSLRFVGLSLNVSPSHINLENELYIFDITYQYCKFSSKCGTFQLQKHTDEAWYCFLTLSKS